MDIHHLHHFQVLDLSEKIPSNQHAVTAWHAPYRMKYNLVARQVQVFHTSSLFPPEVQKMTSIQHKISQSGL